MQLSNLEEGMYRFQLKVSDIAGQSSTADVDVLVRHSETTILHGANFYYILLLIIHVKRIVMTFGKILVDAGPESLITLPQDWVILNGSKSTSDAGIQKWLWNQLK